MEKHQSNINHHTCLNSNPFESQCPYFTDNMGTFRAFYLTAVYLQGIRIMIKMLLVTAVLSFFFFNSFSFLLICSFRSLFHSDLVSEHILFRDYSTKKDHPSSLHHRSLLLFFYNFQITRPILVMHTTHQPGKSIFIIIVYLEMRANQYFSLSLTSIFLFMIKSILFQTPILSSLESCI